MGRGHQSWFYWVDEQMCTLTKNWLEPAFWRCWCTEPKGTQKFLLPNGVEAKEKAFYLNPICSS